MRRSLIIVDNFYTNPHAVREYALSLNFAPSQYVTGYPGIETKEHLHPEQLSRIMNCFSGLIGQRIVFSEGDPQGKFRIQDASLMLDRKNIIHSDATRWSGIIYLSLPEDCKGGLSVYKHKETGLERLFPFDETIQKLMKEKDMSLDELKGWFVQEGLNKNKWVEETFVKCKFNRLLLFDGGLFHGVQELFGTTKENSRLSQHFFFDESSKQ